MRGSRDVVPNMNRIITTLGLLSAALLFAAPLSAQQKRLSPHETISRKIDGNRVVIVYGRPYINDPRTHQPRKIWGDLVPFGERWRLGADEATLLITQKAIVLGGTTVPAGAYSLFMLPQADGTAQLIVNKEIGQWGVDPYHQESELARIPLHHQASDKSVDPLTLGIDKGSSGGGIITISWDRDSYSVPFSVKS